MIFSCCTELCNYGTRNYLSTFCQFCLLQKYSMNWFHRNRLKKWLLCVIWSEIQSTVWFMEIVSIWETFFFWLECFMLLNFLLRQLATSIMLSKHSSSPWSGLVILNQNMDLGQVIKGLNIPWIKSFLWSKE